ncbi:hypothetical protein EJ03DRAFT_333768 [Teratosphaeria nubilosa]|uniref:Uncharacterized protein n=1 Tax=Teratosphaeria nubilosa TaxID=161662 RepID=A0A6G1LKP0_9PEZI|nr:hypothetical protein EJ03DRAFT_333768 [Teratosphaeria nubilosa]
MHVVNVFHPRLFQHPGAALATIICAIIFNFWTIPSHIKTSDQTSTRPNHTLVNPSIAVPCAASGCVLIASVVCAEVGSAQSDPSPVNEFDICIDCLVRHGSHLSELYFTLGDVEERRAISNPFSMWFPTSSGCCLSC